MKNISVTSFKKYLAKKGEFRYHGNPDLINYQVVVKKGNLNRDFCIINDVTFNREIILDKTGDLGAGIKLNRCAGSHLLITECLITQGSDSFDLPSGAGLILDNCQFEKVSIKRNQDFNGNIIIRNKSTIGTLEISESKFSDQGIKIENSIIEELLEINDVDLKDDLIIEKSEIGALCSIKKLKGGLLSFKASHFKNRIRIELSNFNIKLSESIFDSDFIIDSCKIDLFKSYDDCFNKKLLLDIDSSKGQNLGSLKKVKINHSTSNQGIFFLGRDTVLQSIEMVFTDSNRGLFFFYDFREIDSLVLTGTSRNSEISFKNCMFALIHLANFYNYSNLNFSNCDSKNGDSQLNITHSYLGKAVLFKTDFKKFKTINFYDSQISEIETIGPEWFSDEQLFRDNHLVEDHPSNIYRRKKDFYRQLKLSAEKQGNRIQSIEYRSKELKYFLKELKKSKSFMNKDRLMLFLSSSNDMGLNWYKPVALLIIVTCLFYILDIALISNDLVLSNPFNQKSIDYNGTYEIYKSYMDFLPQMLNPTRNLNRIFEDIKPVGFWVQFVDAIHRIFLAFFVFQTLTAFRKYIK